MHKYLHKYEWTQPETLEDIDGTSTFSFKHARMVVRKIEVRKASAVELVGKNDLFVTLEVSFLSITNFYSFHTSLSYSNPPLVLPLCM